jgi:hypothetical protein
MTKLSALILAASIALSLNGQLPASGHLSDAEWQSFHAEVARLQMLLDSAPDDDTVTYQMARTSAFGKQWPETIRWLRLATSRNAGFDPSRDPIFSELAGTQEFNEILHAATRATPPVSHSRIAFTVPEGDLVPESVAYDPKRKRFYFGSMRKGKVIHCSASANCTQFTDNLGTVLGLKVRGRGLWLLSNSDRESSLIHYDLASNRFARSYSVGAGHMFNDLAIAPSGDIYLSDTRAAAVWWLPKGGVKLEKLAGTFEFANGITLSHGGNLLYVSTFPDGVTVVDLRTHRATPIPHPADLCLSTIDGLYFHRGALIAIQNGFMSPRVVRLNLTRDLRAIDRFEVLERRNPLFEGVTTGVIVRGDLYYMANVQDNKKTGFNPLTILRCPL